MDREKVAEVMREYRAGKLRSGSKRGPRVRGKRQALAIALSEGRRAEKGRAARRSRSRR